MIFSQFCIPFFCLYCGNFPGLGISHTILFKVSAVIESISLAYMKVRFSLWMDSGLSEQSIEEMVVFKKGAIAYAICIGAEATA